MALGTMYHRSSTITLISAPRLLRLPLPTTIKSLCLVVISFGNRDLPGTYRIKTSLVISHAVRADLGW